MTVAEVVDSNHLPVIFWFHLCIQYNSQIYLVGMKGLEPIRPYGHQILNLGWLPVSAHPLETKIYSFCLNPKVQNQENLGEKLARITLLRFRYPFQQLG